MSIKHKTIIIKDYLHIFEEYEGSGTIYPGQLLELTSGGKVQKHSGAGKTSLVMVAIEQALEGKTIDDAYASGEMVRVWIPQRGDIAYLKVADEQSITIADFLESDGTGHLRKVSRTNESWESADSQQAKSQYDAHIVGQTLETKDLTSLSTTDSSEFSYTTNQHTLVRIM